MNTDFPITCTHPLIADPLVNRTYDDILAMDDVGFVNYVRSMRAAFLKCWDEQGIAPTNGWSVERINNDFAQLSGFDVQRFWDTDELSGRRVIWNTSAGQVGSAINAWNIANMYKTRINYTLKDNGKSIYDFFSKPELFDRYIPYARRHFLRDSFFMRALTVLTGDALPHRVEVIPENGLEYLRRFATEERAYGTHGVLLQAYPAVKGYVSTSYNDRLRERAPLELSHAELTLALSEGLLPAPACRLLSADELSSPDYLYHVRLYARGERIFPDLFRSFRVSMCQYAVNFPPLTAKLLYETFLAHVTTPEVRVWDPSAGWGGRMLGALSYNRQCADGSVQRMEYIGTDPNPVFYKHGTSMYATVRDYYNAIRSSESLFSTTHDANVLQMGSEDFQHTPEFRDRRGMFDLVFTSPPYWQKEAYSDDPNQSYKKFAGYEAWRDGFLTETLRTAWDALAPDRYLLWNIADVKFGNTLMPLEQDSIAIAKSLGFEYKETILMALASMPGANRVTGDTATTKNYVKVDGKIMKHEPIHVFWKP